MRSQLARPQFPAGQCPETAVVDFDQQGQSEIAAGQARAFHCAIPLAMRIAQTLVMVGMVGQTEKDPLAEPGVGGPGVGGREARAGAGQTPVLKIVDGLQQSDGGISLIQKHAQGDGAKQDRDQAEQRALYQNAVYHTVVEPAPPARQAGEALVFQAPGARPLSLDGARPESAKAFAVAGGGGVGGGAGIAVMAAHMLDGEVIVQHGPQQYPAHPALVTGAAMDQFVRQGDAGTTGSGPGHNAQRGDPGDRVGDPRRAVERQAGGIGQRQADVDPLEREQRINQAGTRSFRASLASDTRPPFIDGDTDPDRPGPPQGDMPGMRPRGEKSQGAKGKEEGQPALDRSYPPWRHEQDSSSSKAMAKTYYIGLGVSYHDPALAIVDEAGAVVFAEATERHLQYKRALNCEPDTLTQLPAWLRRYCPDAEHLVLATNWRTARPWYERAVAALGILTPHGLPRRGIKRLNAPLPNDRLHHMMACNRASIARGGLNLIRRLPELLPGCTWALRDFDHHDTHAVSACYASPYDEAACAVVDSYGERGSLAFYRYRDGRLRKLYEARGPGSLGLYYMKLTELCGFDWLQGEEWKVMGLAPYGRLDERGFNHYKAFISALTKYGISNNVCAFKQSSLIADKFFPDRFFDLIFFDTLHHYEHVNAEINLYKKKIKPGGILCGHDYVNTIPGVVQAVKENFIDFKVESVVWSVNV